MSLSPTGYIALVRSNAQFRRLWYGQIISQFGDWFDNVALFTLIPNLSEGSGIALGGLLVAEFLPPTLISPFAGVIIDRLPRKLVMVLSDLGRALLVLLLLLVQQPGDLWLVYVVVVLKVMLSAFFEPARSALVPNVVSADELIAANGLMGATWSAVLAFGAALGGIVVSLLGIQATFLIDSFSYVLSAWLIAGVVVHETHHTQAARPATAGNRAGLIGGIGRALLAGLRELRAGMRFIRGRVDIFCYTFAKALWNLSGGVLVLYILYGSQIFTLGRADNGALSIGLLYAARGVGAGLGPLVAHKLGGGSLTFLRRAIGLAYFISTLGYLWFSQTQIFALALVAVVIAHIGGSINWVFSTALLQIQVPDQLRGRIFSVEYAALTLATALSSFCTGAASDAGWTPRELAVALALLFILPGIALTALLWREPAPR
jgi:MFS family permease